MPLQLRQICLVARELGPVVEDLASILGVEVCHVDPNVAHFGLENALMPIGRNFIEVVAPIRDGTAAGRYLDRRGGDGGYMVITQADSRETQRAVRQRALDAGVRVAHESTREEWTLCQLHPGDLEAAFLEIETDQYNDFEGHWMPVGGQGWEDKVDQTVVIDMVGVELQATDPEALAARWASIIGATPRPDGEAVGVALNNAMLRFVPVQDGRGPGLGGLDIRVADREHVLRTARDRGCRVDGDVVEICGTRFRLTD